MRTGLRVVALLLMLVTLAWWGFGGANRGWTKTSVPVKRVDPITQIEVDDYVPRFVPGVDFVAGGLMVAGLVAGSSFLFRKASRS